MKEGTRNLFVGLFVVTSLGALAMLMVWFGETPRWLRTSEWTVEIHGVRELRGVADGSPVKLNGVEIGRVTGLDFKNRAQPGLGVVIIASIKNLYTIPRGAVAKVYGATLGIGGGHINIVVPEGGDATPLLRQNAILRGEMASMIGELVTKDLVDSFQRTIDNIGNFAEASKPVAENLERFLEERKVIDVRKGMTANVTTVIERIDNLVAHLNSILGDKNVQGDVKGVVRDLKDTSEDLKATVALWKSETKRLAENVNGAVDRTEENLDRSFRSLNDALGGLGDATKSAAVILAAVERGEGTAGLLAHDERLYEAAVLALGRFDELLATLQRIAGKIEEDGHFTIAQKTAGITFTKNFPIGSKSADKPK